MKKIKYVLLGGIMLMVAIGVYLSFGSSVVKASQSAIALVTTETANSTATSTASYSSLSVATSTKIFNTENGDVVQVYLASYSTSTPPNIVFAFDYSNDGTLWYPYENETFASTATLIAGTKGSLTTWSAATTSANETVTKTITLPLNSFAAKYGRIRYQANVSSTVHVELAVKKQI